MKKKLEKLLDNHIAIIFLIIFWLAIVAGTAEMVYYL